MAQYRRITRACSIDQLRPELGRAIRQHLETRQLTDLLDHVLACCETTSDKVGSSWYDGLVGGARDMPGYLALVVTPDRLIWARSNDRSPATVMSAGFNDLQVKVIQPRGTQDFGLQINIRLDNSRWATLTGQLLLGSGPAAEKFCSTLGEAIGFPIMEPPSKSWMARLFKN